MFPENVTHFERGVGGQGDFRIEKCEILINCIYATVSRPRRAPAGCSESVTAVPAPKTCDNGYRVRY